MYSKQVLGVSTHGKKYQAKKSRKLFLGIDKFEVELELTKWNRVELELTKWN